MKIEVKQLSKYPDGAEFRILRNNKIFGGADFSCVESKTDGVISIVLKDENSGVKEIALRHDENPKTHKKRMYHLDNEYTETGVATIYMGSHKFHKHKKYETIRFYYKSSIYTVQPLCTTNGIATFFKNGNVIANVYDGGITYDDLHDYKIELINENEVMASIILCIYLYLIHGFKTKKDEVYNYFEKLCHNFKKMGGKK